jgi:hypothetical protein
MEKVWLAQHEIDYEGSDVIGVYASSDAAMRGVEKYWADKGNTDTPDWHRPKWSPDAWVWHIAGQDFEVTEWEVES